MPEEILLVSVDGKLFVQVLLNLLDNAYKHSGSDTQISLSVYQKDTNIIFEVSDNGIGIESSILPSIFDGFVTRPTHIADKGRGVGLGLFICREILRAHGGTIIASNKKAPEHGAIFTISLPFQEV